MSEVAHDHPQVYESDYQPLDALRPLRDPSVVEFWINSEKTINRLQNLSTVICQNTISDAADFLNETFQTDTLGGEPVVASGIMFSTIDKDKSEFEARYAHQVESGLYRYGQIKFIRVKDREKKHGTQYYAAVKLMPAKTVPDTQMSYHYMLLDDAKQLELPQKLTPVIHPEDYENILTGIVDDSQLFRARKRFMNMPIENQQKAMERRCREYGKRLLPLIDSQIAILVDTDRYAEQKTDKTLLFHTKKEKNIEDRFILAGHLQRIAFIGNMLDLNEIPHLVLENKQKNLTYTIPLDANYQIYSL